MGEWTMDVYATGDLWIDERSDLDLALMNAEWERRVPRNCLTIIPAGVCRGKNARASLEWLDSQPGLKVIARGSNENWTVQDTEGLKSVVVMGRRGARRIRCRKQDGPCIVIFTTPSWDLTTVTDYDATCKEWAGAISDAFEQAKKVSNNSKDVFIYVSEHTPIDGFRDTPMAAALDKHDVKLILFAPDPEPRQWGTYYQGRFGKNQYQAPDYRLVSADFLSWAPTRVGDIDAYSWTRKDRERVATTQLSWQYSKNAEPRDTPKLTITRASHHGEPLYNLDSLKVEPAAPLAAPSRDQLTLDAATATRYRTMLVALKPLPDSATISDMRQSHGHVAENYAVELDGVPYSTTMGRLRAETARLLRGGGSDSWINELLDMEDGLTIGELKQDSQSTYTRLASHFVGYSLDVRLDKVAEDALRDESPKRRGGLLGTLLKGVAGVIHHDGANASSQVTVDQAQRAVLAVDCDDSDAFELELAKAVVRYGDVKRATSTVVTTTSPAQTPRIGY